MMSIRRLGIVVVSPNVVWAAWAGDGSGRKPAKVYASIVRFTFTRKPLLVSCMETKYFKDTVSKRHRV